MSCTHIYDFMTGARIQLPTVLRTGVATGDDGRQEVRAILNAGEAAQSLMRDQMRMLSTMNHTPQ